MMKRLASAAVRGTFILLAFCSLSGCDHGTATESMCASVAGMYSVSWSDSCGRSGTMQWTLLQDGCAFHNSVSPDEGSVSGSITGNMAAVTITSGFIACSYTLNGTANFADGTLIGSASGTVSGSGCCSPLTLHFTAIQLG